jgi:hypothetical protein
MISNELGQRTVGEEFGDANFGLSAVYFLGGALFCVPMAVFGLLSGRRAPTGGESPPGGARSLLALWIAIPLVVFSAASSQRVNYVAPLVPAAAILAGAAWARLVAEWDAAGRGRRAAAYATITLLVLAAPASLAVCIAVPRLSPAMLSAVAAGAGVLGAAGTVALLAMRRGRRGEARRALVVAACGLWLVSVAATRAIKEHRSARNVLLSLEARGDLPERLLAFESSASSATFYLRRPLRSCDEQTADFDWPDGHPLKGIPPPPADKMLIRDRARQPGGAWVLVADDRLADLNRFVLRIGCHYGGTYRAGGATVAQVFQRPTMIAPGAPPAHTGTVRRPPPPAGPKNGGALEPPPPKEDRLRELLAGTRSPDPAVRYRAARALGKIGAPAKRAAPALLACMGDPHWLVRRYAATSLGALKGPGPEVLAALGRALGDEDWEVRRVAARSIGWIGRSDRAGVEGLTRLLSDEYWSARKYAAGSLGRLGPAAKSAIPALEKALSDPEIQVRREARAAIAAIGRAQ